jgi:hypothetical protein
MTADTTITQNTQAPSTQPCKHTDDDDSGHGRTISQGSVCATATRMSLMRGSAEMNIDMLHKHTRRERSGPVHIPRVWVLTSR